MHKILLFLISLNILNYSCFCQENSFRVNGIDLSYEIVGKDKPILLFLHGALQDISDWKIQKEYFRSNYSMIFIDTRGHGKSSFYDTTLTYDLFANDVKLVLDSLKLDSMIVVGWSDGANTGMSLAINFPKKVKKLISIGGNIFPDSSAVKIEAIKNIESWSSELGYQRVFNYFKKKYSNHFNPAIFPLFIKRMQTLLLTEPNLTPNDLSRIKCPTMFICGDKDVIKIEHTLLMYESVPNSFLAILPDTDHYSPQTNSIVCNQIILNFINK